jgi:hypothetical protein
LVANELGLHPSQYEEKLFKSILGNSQAIVDNLASLRNSSGDAHGTGRAIAKPLPRHARFAVNLAGSISTFLLETFAARK